MKSLRLAALAATLCCTVGLLAAGPAAAQTMPTPFTQKVEVTGTKGFKGTYTIERFARAGGKVVSVGTLKGTLRGRTVRRQNVRMPVRIVNAQTGRVHQLPPTPGACSVLNLVLGPIDINVLGVRVRTSQINLRVEAVPSTVPGGGLLGDLLCGVTNLLNPAANTALGQLVQLLNGLLALAPTG